MSCTPPEENYFTYSDEDRRSMRVTHCHYRLYNERDERATVERYVRYQAMAATTLFQNRAEMDEYGAVPENGWQALRKLRSLPNCSWVVPKRRAERKTKMITRKRKCSEDSLLALNEGQRKRFRDLYLATEHHLKSTYERGRAMLDEEREKRRAAVTMTELFVPPINKSPGGTNYSGWCGQAQEMEDDWDLMETLTQGAFRDPDVEPSSDEEDEGRTDDQKLSSTQRDLFCYEPISAPSTVDAIEVSDDDDEEEQEPPLEEEEEYVTDDGLPEESSMTPPRLLSVSLAIAREEEKGQRLDMARTCQELWRKEKDSECSEQELQLLRIEKECCKRSLVAAVEKVLILEAVVDWHEENGKTEEDRRMLEELWAETDREAERERAIGRVPVIAFASCFNYPKDG